MWPSINLQCLFKSNFVSYLSKAIFLVSRHVLIIGEVRRLSTSFLFGVIDPSVKRFMCWEISKRSVVTNLSSWFISISSAQPPVSVGTLHLILKEKKKKNTFPTAIHNEKTEHILYSKSQQLLIHWFHLGANEKQVRNWSKLLALLPNFDLKFTQKNTNKNPSHYVKAQNHYLQDTNGIYIQIFPKIQCSASTGFFKQNWGFSWWFTHYLVINRADTLKHLPSPLKIKLRLPLSQLIFSNPSNVISTRNLAPLFQMRQTSLGQTLETSGTTKENKEHINITYSRHGAHQKPELKQKPYPWYRNCSVLRASFHRKQARLFSKPDRVTISLGTKPINSNLKINMKRNEASGQTNRREMG